MKKYKDNPVILQQPGAKEIQDKLLRIIKLLENFSQLDDLKALKENEFNSAKDNLGLFLPQLNSKNKIQNIDGGLVKSKDYSLERYYQYSNEVDVLAEYFRNSGDNVILTASDSHRTTGTVFHGLENAGGWVEKKRPSGVAILAFDHHIDAINDRDVSDIQKSTVLGRLLQQKYIDKLAVIGPPATHRKVEGQEVGNISVVYNKDVYSGDQPSSDLFLQKLRVIFAEWQKQGIKRIYPSIDIDGLRIDEMNYTGTDYIRMPYLRSGILYQPLFEKYFNIEESLDVKSDKKIEILCHFIKEFPIEYYEGDVSREYKGMPAKWVGMALDMAKEYGFEIGLKNEKTGQVIAGDGKTPARLAARRVV